MEIVQGIPTDMNFRTGYSGRTAVFEIMELTNVIQDAIHEGEPSYRIRQVAMNDGMVSLEDSTRRKVLDKVTSIAELSRVISDTISRKISARCGDHIISSSCDAVSCKKRNEARGLSEKPVTRLSRVEHVQPILDSGESSYGEVELFEQALSLRHFYQRNSTP